MAASAYLQETALERVAVDFEACRKLGALIRSKQIPADHEDSSLSGITPREIGNFYLLLVAICHQTSPREKPPLEGNVGEQHLRGWDYLSAKFETAVRENPDILTPEYWAGIKADQVRKLFHDKTLGDRLSDPSGRALLIADLGARMLEHRWTWADDRMIFMLKPRDTLRVARRILSNCFPHSALMTIQSTRRLFSSWR